MKQRQRTIIPAILFFLASSGAYAQNTFPVTMKLADGTSGEPVAFATVSLTPDGSEKASEYVLSDNNGLAVISGIKSGNYILKAELVGYETYLKEIVINKALDLGTIKMKIDAELIEAASVSAAGNPIIVKKDTIEYNASSFKTTDNDMLEDLLKKLPGVEVSSDGTVTANGETISKITIDGKTFFLDDPQLATKNIPANLVEKVKVVEKKSEQARFTGIDDGQEETVIDLSIYKGKMNGWFGNLMAGGGHDVPDKGYYTEETTFSGDGWRYQGAGIIGNFKENSQLSIILNTNNTNNRGFNDLAGNMMQGMRGSGGMGQGINPFGNNNGITSSLMGGINGSWDLFDDRMVLSGNYLFNGSSNYVEETSTKTTFMEDGSRLVNDNNGSSTTDSQGHRFGLRLEHKFSENTFIMFEPQFNFGKGSFSEHSDFSTYSYDGTETSFANSGFKDNTGSNKNWTASGKLFFGQRLGKAGRTLSAMLDYDFSNNLTNGFNQSLTRTDIDGNSDYENEIVNQRYDQHSDGSSLSGRVVYTEPLTEHLFLEANYEYAWSGNKSWKNTFNSGNTDIDMNTSALTYYPDGESPDSKYSSSVQNRYVNQRAGASLTWQTDKLNAQLGAQINPANTHNETNGKTYDSNVTNWSPSARLRYMVNDNTHLIIFYDGRTSQPSTSQLMPVPDNTDPLNISFGNPYLEPYFSHNLRGMFRYTNKKTYTSVNAHINGSIVRNAITNAQWYDTSGAQYSVPVNGPASSSLNAMVTVNSPIAKSNFSLMSMTNAKYGRSTSYIGTSSFDSDKYYDAENSEFKYDAFKEDYPDLSRTDNFTTNRIRTMSIMEMLRLTYRNDFVELIAGGRTNVSKSWYTMKSANANTTWNNSISFEMNWTLPFGMDITGDINYNWYRGYSTYQKPEFILNAEISQLVFKKRATISLRAYDILNQVKNLMVTDASNYHQEVRNNTLGRYIMLSFTYRFGTFNGKRKDGPRGFGGPPPGGPAGGPPPM